MATFLLLHGAASDGWYWHRVVPELEARGHAAIAPDLPCDDDTATFPDYAEAAVAALGERPPDDLVVVAQSLAGFTGPLVCDLVPAQLLVLLAAMVPSPRERAGDWWERTGWEAAWRALAEAQGREVGDDHDAMVEFFHDVPADVVAEAMARGERHQSGTPMEQPWPLDAWPDVPTRFVLCRDDRFFPADLQRRVVRERLGIEADEMGGGHLPALARPAELAALLHSFVGGGTEP